MAIALDTSVLIAWEKAGGLPDFLAEHEGPFYVPAHAAAEFLLGTHPPVRADLRERARRLYEAQIKGLVDAFDEPDASQLAVLNAELRPRGQTMNFYDRASLRRLPRLVEFAPERSRAVDKVVLPGVGAPICNRLSAHRLPHLLEIRSLKADWKSALRLCPAP
jgi:predicted nucleic acid-binding protein